MALVTRRKVTIVAEALLEERLIRELRALGARGVTIGPVRGEGSRGVRSGDWEGSNVRLESIVSREVADAILARIAERYFDDYAVIAWVDDVEVVRGDKYG
ncbi:MAG: hypothetical protein RL338_463 [Chloroflexota bacterium]|jgi:nitrogen regulatory protein PII